MASNPSLIYPGADPLQARVLALAIRPGVKVLRLRTPHACRRLMRLHSLDDYALLYHEIAYANGSLVREWVVLDAHAIEAASCHPAVVSPLLRAELSRLRDPAYHYPLRALHNRSAPLRAGGRLTALSVALPGLRERILVPRLRAVLALRPGDVPDAFRDPWVAPPRPAKVVLLDMGNVLTRFSWTALMSRLARRSARSAGAVRGLFWAERIVERVEDGSLTPAKLQGLLRRRLGYRGSKRDFDALWCEGLEPTGEAVRLLTNGGQPRWLVSNVGAAHWAAARRVLPQLAALKGATLSFREGRRKPDPALLRAALRAAGVRAGEAALVDDQPANVAAARRLGLRAVLWVPGPGLARRLFEAGVTLSPSCRPAPEALYSAS